MFEETANAKILAPTLLSLLLLSACKAGRAPPAENVCTRPWNDTCPAAGNNKPGCSTYAPPLPQPTDWLSVRASLINTLFGVADGKLPATPAPNFIIPVPGNTSRGCWCSTLGNCNASECTWRSNLTQLIHTTTARVNATFSLALNSTVFLSLNTSGVAPILYGGPFSPSFPDFPEPPTRASDTLVVLHQGHNSPCVLPGGDVDFDSTVDYLNQLGYDVANHHMPTYQPNAENPYNVQCDHSWFGQWEALGVPVFRFFLEPVVRTINFAVGTLGYKRIVMAGLSGGGWSTTMLSGEESALFPAGAQPRAPPAPLAMHPLTHIHPCSRSH